MPIVTIQSPSGGSFQIDAPEGATDEQIFKFAQSQGLMNEPESQPQLRPEQAATPANQDFIPTEENLAIPAPGLPERSFADQAIGAGEAALTMATGATGGMVGGLVGAVEGIGRELAGDIPTGEGANIMAERASQLTYAPRTEAGQEIVSDIGEKLSVLPPVLGTPLASVKGLGTAARAKVTNTKSPLFKKIAEESTGDLQKSFDRSLDDSKFSPRVFGVVKEARKQGFDDATTTMIANSSKVDKRRMLQMVNKMEQALGDAELRATIRPADIAGDSLLRKINFVKSNNKAAGVQLGRIAKNLEGKSVDVNEPINNFFNKAADMGITFNDDGVPNFKGSQIDRIPADMKLVNDITYRIRGLREPDALKAHEFKKYIDKKVFAGKRDSKGLDHDTESLVKGLRSEVNDSLSNKFSEYKEANKRFSDTVQALDSIQDAAGKKIDFFAPNAEKAVGTVLRSLMNNTKGRANLMNAVENIEVTSAKYGGSFDDKILRQMLFADLLDDSFGSSAKTGLRSELAKGNVDAAVDISQMSIPGAIALGVKTGARKIKGINQKNQIKSLKALLRN
ncbi:MAG TPA: hypothetical protein EYN54_06020 [Methylococcaceae bacterium]|nr:hypothetical protein [Methylococcaceae bacterium]